jgi:hypothetical protein
VFGYLVGKTLYLCISIRGIDLAAIASMKGFEIIAAQTVVVKDTVNVGAGNAAAVNFITADGQTGKQVIPDASEYFRVSVDDVVINQQGSLDGACAIRAIGYNLFCISIVRKLFQL